MNIFIGIILGILIYCIIRTIIIRKRVHNLSIEATQIMKKLSDMNMNPMKLPKPTVNPTAPTLQDLMGDIRDLKNTMVALGKYLNIEFQVHQIDNPEYKAPQVEVVKIVKISKTKSLKKRK